MTIVDCLVLAVIAGVLGLAAWYVYKAKKSGRKCIGCPDGSCNHCSSCASCSCGCNK